MRKISKEALLEQLVQETHQQFIKYEDEFTVDEFMAQFQRVAGKAIGSTAARDLLKKWVEQKRLTTRLIQEGAVRRRVWRANHQ